MITGLRLVPESSRSTGGVACSAGVGVILPSSQLSLNSCTTVSGLWNFDRSPVTGADGHVSLRLLRTVPSFMRPWLFSVRWRVRVCCIQIPFSTSLEAWNVKKLVTRPSSFCRMMTNAWDACYDEYASRRGDESQT